MPRPKRMRKMTNPPKFKGFKPIGMKHESEPVVVNFEEFEAIRLCDYQLLGQVEAAVIMEVSRPTFARIYESARRKVAKAFTEGKPIVFEGGKVYFDSHWFACNDCGCWFNHPPGESEVASCALCSSKNIEQYNEDITDIENEYFYCPECGEKKVVSGKLSCRNDLCPKCNRPMKIKQLPL